MFLSEPVDCRWVITYIYPTGILEFSFYYSSIVGRLEIPSSLALVLTSFCQWVVKCPNRYSECNKIWSEKVWSSIVRQEKYLEDGRVETSNGDDALVRTGGR